MNVQTGIRVAWCRCSRVARYRIIHGEHTRFTRCLPRVRRRHPSQERRRERRRLCRYRSHHQRPRRPALGAPLSHDGRVASKGYRPAMIERPAPLLQLYLCRRRLLHRFPVRRSSAAAAAAAAAATATSVAAAAAAGVARLAMLARGEVHQGVGGGAARDGEEGPRETRSGEAKRDRTRSPEGDEDDEEDPQPAKVAHIRPVLAAAPAVVLVLGRRRVEGSCW